MIYAIISDIHANLEALDAVLADIDKQDADETYCLGDLVGYGPSPVEVYERIKQSGIKKVRGNHDNALMDKSQWPLTRDQALITVQDHLRQLGHRAEELAQERLTLTLNEERKIHITHAGVYKPELFHYIIRADYSIDGITAINNFRHMQKGDICFAGHTHSPRIVERKNAKIFVRNIIIQGNEEIITITPNKTYVDVGSVGQPRDGDRRAGYVIYDSEQQTVRWRKIEYDIATTLRKIEQWEAIPPLMRLQLRNRLINGQ